MVYFFNYLDLQNAHGRESGEENAVIAALACTIGCILTSILHLT